MKIKGDYTVRISGKTSASELFRNMKKGSTISGKIFQRLGDGQALLDIGGKKIRADFLQGVPEGDRCVLLLEEKSGGVLKFRRVLDKGEIVSLKQTLSDIVLFKTDGFTEPNMQAIQGFIRSGFPGLYALNSSIYQMVLGTHLPENGLTRLLNRLRKMGISGDKLVLFSYLFHGEESISNNILKWMFSFLQHFNKGFVEDFQNAYRDNEMLEEKIESIADDIRHILGKKEDGGKLFNEVMSFLGATGEKKTSEYTGFEIPIFDNDSFRPVHGILSPEGIVIFLELTHLGPLDILAKETGSGVVVRIVCHDESAVPLLRKKIDDLKTSVNSSIDAGFFIVVQGRHELVEQLTGLNPLSARNIVDTKA